MLQGTLGLDEILRREITTDWYEGVAVIQAVCRAVPGIGAPGAGFPTPRQISIKATGEIELLGVTSSPDAVVAAGRLLGEMLHNDVPVRLRLTHSEAVATRPAFATLQDFVNALAYFERPDGPQTIQKLYTRASAARERSGQGGQAQAGNQPVAPGQNGAPAELKQEHPPRQKRRSNPLFAVAAGIVLVVVAATAFLAYGGRQVAATFTAQAAALFSGGDEPLEESSKPENDRAGKPGAKAAAVGARSTRRGEAASSTSRPGAARPPVRLVSRSTPRGPAVLPALDTRGPVPSPILLAGLSGVPLFHETIEVQVEDARESGEVAVPVYSRLDGDVRPPIAIRPHLPTEPPAHIPVDHLMVLDLVVANDGVVESVRLLTDPRTVNDFMIVSAAKAWLFAPAILDGQPVKYRHRIRFAVP